MFLVGFLGSGRGGDLSGIFDKWERWEFKWDFCKWEGYVFSGIFVSGIWEGVQV